MKSASESDTNCWVSHKAMDMLPPNMHSACGIWKKWKYLFLPFLGFVNNKPLFWILYYVLTSFLFILILISSSRPWVAIYTRWGNSSYEPVRANGSQGIWEWFSALVVYQEHMFWPWLYPLTFQKSKCPHCTPHQLNWKLWEWNESISNS